jgi:hypothetical protein
MRDRIAKVLSHSQRRASKLLSNDIEALVGVRHGSATPHADDAATADAADPPQAFAVEGCFATELFSNKSAGLRFFDIDSVVISLW